MAASPSRTESEEALREELARHRAISPAYDVFGELGIPAADHFILMVALMRAHEIVHATVERILKSHGLSQAHYLMMSNLQLRGQHRPLLVGRLARRMLVHPTTVTLRLDQLEKRGLVLRERHPNDRRGVLVSLTDEGCELLERAHRDLAKSQFGLPGIDSKSALQLIEHLMPTIQHDVEEAGLEFDEDMD